MTSQSDNAPLAIICLDAASISLLTDTCCGLASVFNFLRSMTANFVKCATFAVMIPVFTSNNAGKGIHWFVVSSSHTSAKLSGESVNTGTLINM
ncbi:hypothetical protein D3C73_915820 [compost metagenome]